MHSASSAWIPLVCVSMALMVLLSMKTECIMEYRRSVGLQHYVRITSEHSSVLHMGASRLATTHHVGTSITQHNFNQTFVKTLLS